MGSRKRRIKLKSFEDEIRQLEADPQVLRMQQYQHHYHTTTYRHCYRVSCSAYHLAQKLHIQVDGQALARGAMLHDFYLYGNEGGQTMGKRPLKGMQHGYHHAERALENADRYFLLSDKERNIIYSHMWPLNLTHLPRSKEAVLVCIADKICAVQELMGRTGHSVPVHPSKKSEAS